MAAGPTGKEARAAALRLLRPLADRSGLVLLAPASVGPTREVIAGGFGPDVRTIDELLREVSSAVPVGSFSIGGFRDGASYALSLGVANGDVFESVLAFSPGFMTSSVRNGTPRCFVSHGVRDAVLPIDMCSRRLVPRLRQAGYDVVYREFDGPHEAPAAIAAEAVHWLGDTQSAAGMPAREKGRGPADRRSALRRGGTALRATRSTARGHRRHVQKHRGPSTFPQR